MTTHQFLCPEDWAPPKGYANGMMAPEGRLIALGGMIGWNAEQQFECDDMAGQVEQTLANIARVLVEADALPTDVIRLTWYITDRHEYRSSLKEIGVAYRRVFGRHFPVMTVVQVVALMEDRAKVEIEATAVLRADGVDQGRRA